MPDTPTIPISAIDIVPPDVPLLLSGRTLQYAWDCPGCGQRTFATREENTTPEAIAADPLCHTCRKARSANA